MKAEISGNVLLVANFPSDTGYAWWLMEHFWRILAAKFIEAGKRAYVAYPAITVQPDALIQAGIEPVELTLPWSDADGRTAALEFIRKNEIHTIYFTDRPWFDTRYSWLRWAGVKTILIHDHAPGDRPPSDGLRGLIKAARHRLRPLCGDYHFCVSELMSERAIRSQRVPPQRVITVQNGVLEAEPKPHRENIRATLGLRQDAAVVITTGRAHPYKRLDFVIRTAALLRQRRPDLDVMFLVVGDGPALGDLKHLVSSLGLEDTVKLTGFHPTARALLPAADIAMHAALGEGFSLSIAEYMRAGLAVLVPDIPSVCQAIDHGSTGLTYKHDSEYEAMLALIALASEPSYRAQLGMAAKAKADQRYSLTRCSSEFEQALGQTLTSHWRRSPSSVRNMWPIGLSRSKHRPSAP